MGGTQTLPNRLRRLREAQGESPEQLAVEFGVRAQSVEYWERVNIPSNRIAPLARHFGVTADHLLGMDEEAA